MKVINTPALPEFYSMWHAPFFRDNSKPFGFRIGGHGVMESLRKGFLGWSVNDIENQRVFVDDNVTKIKQSPPLSETEFIYKDDLLKLACMQVVSKAAYGFLAAGLVTFASAEVSIPIGAHAFLVGVREIASLYLSASK